MSTPSLALIPTGFKAGKVYSVLPETGVGDFDFTRASAATRINSNGLLEVAQYSIGGELVTNGDFATDSDWSLNSNWLISGGTANADGTSSNPMFQDGVITGGKQYLVTYTLSNFTQGSVYVDLGSGGIGTTRTASGTYTDVILAAGNNNRFYLRGSGNFILSIDNVSVIEYAINDVPRLEYPLIDGVVNGCPSLLLEPQATNLITYPISFDNAYWTKSGATIDDNAGAGYSSPSVDFPTSAFKLVESATTAAHFQVTSALSNGVIGNSYSSSFFAKKGENNNIQLSFGSGSFSNSYANFNLNSGTITVENNLTAKIELLPNGWYKCSATAVATNTGSTSSIIGLIDSDSSTRIQSYTGDGTSGVYLFMAQLETGSVATSPTLTSLSAEGTTTTRVTETCNGAGDASTFNDSEGVLFAEISALANDLTNRFISISNGSKAERVLLGYSNVSNKIFAFSYVGSVLQCNISFVLPDMLDYNKIALKYKENDFALWVNGVEVGIDLVGSVSASNTFNKLAFDEGDGTDVFYSKTKQVQVFNTALTDLEIETLTSWTSFTAMANAQQYNII